MVETTDTTPPPQPAGDVGYPELVISVVADGPGIDSEFLPRVFEKFEKISFSSGTGLGLYVVRLMADAIGCSVAVASGPAPSRSACLPRTLQHVRGPHERPHGVGSDRLGRMPLECPDVVGHRTERV